MNLPNVLTLSRILMIPLMVMSFYWFGKHAHLIAAALFAVASITDWFDGYLARKWNQATPLGAFLDPVADKLIVAVALVLLVEHFGVLWMTIPACIMIGREIIISALREWMAELGKRASGNSSVGRAQPCQGWRHKGFKIPRLMGVPVRFWPGAPFKTSYKSTTLKNIFFYSLLFISRFPHFILLLKLSSGFNLIASFKWSGDKWAYLVVMFKVE